MSIILMMVFMHTIKLNRSGRANKHKADASFYEKVSW